MLGRTGLLAFLLPALASALLLDRFRLTPDPGTVASPDFNFFGGCSRTSKCTRFSLDWNQPVEIHPTNNGNFTIYFNGSTGLEPVFSTPVRSPFVWVNYATVNLDISADLFQRDGEYSISLSDASFVASAMDESFSTGISASEWSFQVLASGAPKYNSSIPTPTYSTDIAQLISQMQAANVAATIQKLASHYNRFFQSQSGLDSHVWLKQQYDALVQPNKLGENPTVSSFPHRWLMPSLIARIPADPSSPLADEVIILGAHLDSINRQNWTVNVKAGEAPGADDNASGVALQLEMFRLLTAAKYAGTRTIEFHAYAAEEEGLYGSLDVAASYTRQGVKVAAMLQLDQCAYVRDPANPVVALFTDHTDPLLTSLVRDVLGLYVSSTTVITSDEAGRADSDFHSWHIHGFRAAYLAEGPVDDIVYGNSKHTAYDRFETIDMDHAMRIGAASLAYLLHMSS